MTAVALAVALLAVSLPAVEEAGRAHSDARVANELDRLESAARSLRAGSAATRHGPTARRTLAVSLPEDSWAHPGLARLRIPPPGGGKVSWRVHGGPTHSRQLLGGDLVGPQGGLTLRAGGSRELVLLLRPGGTVELRRLNFITERRATGAHATPNLARR